MLVSFVAIALTVLTAAIVNAFAARIRFLKKKSRARAKKFLNATDESIICATSKVARAAKVIPTQ